MLLESKLNRQPRQDENGGRWRKKAVSSITIGVKRAEAIIVPFVRSENREGDVPPYFFGADRFISEKILDSKVFDAQDSVRGIVWGKSSSIVIMCVEIG